MEVKDFGINVTLIEPNSFKTDFFGSSAIENASIEDYAKATSYYRNGDGVKPENIGDPNATVELFLNIVDAEKPQLRLFMGKLAYPWTQYTYSQKLAFWGEWKVVSAKVHGH